MNQLHIGLLRRVRPPKRGGFLFIDNKPPIVPIKRVFDPRVHSVNVLTHINHIKARQLANAIYAVASEGKETLTVRNGKRALAHLFMGRFETVVQIEEWLRNKSAEEKGLSPAYEEALGTLSDILLSPVMRKFLSYRTNFSFDTKSPIAARIDPAILGRQDAHLITLFLIAHYNGPTIVPNYGPYATTDHLDLIDQDRFIIGINALRELPPKLQDAVLLIKDKHIHGALYKDAVQLAQLKGLRPDPLRDDNKYNDFIARAIAQP